jgi:hypothetical protein
MTDWTLPMDGGCRCGKVRLRISKPPMITMLCHCTGCQRMTASAFSTTIIVPTDGFEVTEGETVIGGIHGDQGRHHHCDWCKSWLFTRIVPEMGFVNVRATMLDDATWFVPFAEVFTSEALPWAIAGAPHAYEQFPPMEDYQTLIGAFAES